MQVNLTVKIVKIVIILKMDELPTSSKEVHNRMLTRGVQQAHAHLILISETENLQLHHDTDLRILTHI